MNQMTLHSVSVYSAAEPTRQIAWAFPAEPRFRVTRGGLSQDWKPFLHAAVGIGLVGVFILLTIFCPHFLRGSARTTARIALPPMPAPSITSRLTVIPAPLMPPADLVRLQGFRVAPAAPTAGRALIYQYVN